MMNEMTDSLEEIALHIEEYAAISGILHSAYEADADIDPSDMCKVEDLCYRGLMGLSDKIDGVIKKYGKKPHTPVV